MYADILIKAPLFEGVDEAEIPGILERLKAYRKRYSKGERVIWEGDTVRDLGILLHGKAKTTKTDLNGRQVIVTLLKPGSYIGVLLASSKGRKSPVSVEVQEDAEVLFIPIKNILSDVNCPFHACILENLMSGISGMALVLHERNDCLIKPSIREKILTFLSREAERRGKNNIVISMDRVALAEYLNTDRSALSRELSSMKKDGLIEYHKNVFALLK